MNHQLLTEPTTVTDYPYGSLKCSMTFSVEYVKGKGYRQVMQSVNPKTDRVNKPKKSTYTDFLYMYKDAETGHVKFAGWSFGSFDSVTKLIALMKQYQFKFTAEQSEDLWIDIIGGLKISLQYTTKKEGVNNDQLIEAVKFREMIRHYKNGSNICNLINLEYDIETIKSMIV